MKQENIKELTGIFESFSNKMDNGIEFWFARDLQHLLGYTKWNNLDPKRKIIFYNSLFIFSNKQ